VIVGSWPWESPPVVDISSRLSPRTLVPIHDLDCSRLRTPSEARAPTAATPDVHTEAPRE
jgi:hypothetical protein